MKISVQINEFSLIEDNQQPYQKTGYEQNTKTPFTCSTYTLPTPPSARRNTIRSSTAWIVFIYYTLCAWNHTVCVFLCLTSFIPHYVCLDYLYFCN